MAVNRPCSKECWCVWGGQVYTVYSVSLSLTVALHTAVTALSAKEKHPFVLLLLMLQTGYK